LQKLAFYYAYSQFDNKKIVVAKLVLSYNRLKLKLRVFLAGHRVAMVTYYAISITIIGSKMAERLRDTNIVALFDKFK